MDDLKQIEWYWYDIEKLSESECYRWYSLMDRERQEYVRKHRLEADRKRIVAGEMLARKAIALRCDVPEESIEFGKGEYGKPFAKNLNVEFSVSHSDNLVVCAVSDCPIGIDVEKIRPIDLNIAEEFCSEGELEYIFGGDRKEVGYLACGEDEALTRFFEIWTAKEAYSKFTGRGLGDICNMPDMAASQRIKRLTLGAYAIAVYGG